MGVISIKQSLAETASLQRRLAETRGDAVPQAEALRAALAPPCARHAFHLDELWADLAQELHNLGHWDAAIEAMEQAIVHGVRAEPDPRADIAGWHLQAGRREEADALYAGLRKEFPDDVWLANNAAMAYADVGDHATALEWLTQGLQRTMADGDPNRLVDQLVELRRESLTALGHDPDDELTASGVAFAKSWTRPPTSVRFKPDHLPPEPGRHPCDHCGYDPDVVLEWVDSGLTSDALEVPPPASAHRQSTLAFAWFPKDDWPRARRLWKELAEDWPADHTEYSHDIEARMKGTVAAVAGRGNASVSPLPIDEYLVFCQRKGIDPSTLESRALWAAEAERSGYSQPWPPQRNEPCWCGSGAKYKRCCGPVPPEPRLMART